MIFEPVALKRIIRQRQALGELAGFPGVGLLNPVTCDTSCWRALYTNHCGIASIFVAKNSIFVAVVKYFAGLYGFPKKER